MDHGDQAREIEAAVWDFYPEYLTLTGVVDNPIMKLIYLNVMIQMFGDIPHSNVLVQALVMDMLKTQQKSAIRDVSSWIRNRFQ